MKKHPKYRIIELALPIVLDGFVKYPFVVKKKTFLGWKDIHYDTTLANAKEYLEFLKRKDRIVFEI
jgi:hypothetical protein